MVCIYCGGKTQVTNSRSQIRNNSIWRRRECTQCQATVTTSENIELPTALVVTSDKAHQPFSRDVLFISIYDSCKHRKTAVRDATHLTDTIIKHIYPLISGAAVTKDQIRQTALPILQRFDKAAASYYGAYFS